MINQQLINETIIKDKGQLLKPHYKKNWSINNITYGYCYIISEALYHYGDYSEYKPFCINFGENVGTHWFLSDGTNIIDFTYQQFNFSIDYNKGIRKMFLKGSIETPKGYISKRGYKVAQLLKLI